MAITTPIPGGSFLMSGPAGANGRDGRDGQNGADGGAGRDGQDGRNGRDGAGTVTTRTARTRILPGSAVVLDGDFYAVPVDPYNLDHCGLAAGVTALGAEANQTVTIQASGDLDGITGDFGPGDLLFAAANGTLTRTPPTSTPDRPAWRQSYGRANTATRIIIDRGFAYRLPTVVTALPVSDLDAVTAILMAALTPAVAAQIHARMVATLPSLPPDDAIPNAGGTYVSGGQVIVVPRKS